MMNAADAFNSLVMRSPIQLITDVIIVEVFANPKHVGKMTSWLIEVFGWRFG